MELTLVVLEPELAVCKIGPDQSIPPWSTKGQFFSLTKTADELSIVCEQSQVPQGVESEAGWRALKVLGPLDFGLTGILASIANPLAAASISIFALSTFDTDYVLVKASQLELAQTVLSKAGYEIR
jgi:hypothetical protein